MLAVRGHRVLVQAINPPERQHASGILTIRDERPDVMGRVTYCGESVREVKPGDLVVFLPSAGQVLEHDATRYLVLTEDELVGIWE